MVEPLDYSVGDRAIVVSPDTGVEDQMVVTKVFENGMAILHSKATIKGVLFNSDGKSQFGFFQITKLIPKAENGIQRK